MPWINSALIAQFLRGLNRISWLYPFYKGRGRLALLNVGLETSNNFVFAKIKNGQKIYLYTKDYIGQMILLFGDLDPVVSTFILNNIACGDTIIDAGANLGLISLPASKKVWPLGKVIAYEPNPVCIEALIKSKEENKVENLEIKCLALSNFVGKAVINVPFASYGQAKLTADLNSGGCICEVTTLDASLRDLNIDRIRLLKIDVEGHEYQVLLGGHQSLASGKIDLVVFESHPTNTCFGKRQEINLLHSHKYKIYEIFKRPLLQIGIAETYHNYIPHGSEFVAIRNGLTIDLASCLVSSSVGIMS